MSVYVSEVFGSLVGSSGPLLWHETSEESLDHSLPQTVLLLFDIVLLQSQVLVNLRN